MCVGTRVPWYVYGNQCSRDQLTLSNYVTPQTSGLRPCGRLLYPLNHLLAALGYIFFPFRIKPYGVPKKQSAYSSIGPVELPAGGRPSVQDLTVPLPSGIPLCLRDKSQPLEPLVVSSGCPGLNPKI